MDSFHRQPQAGMNAGRSMPTSKTCKAQTGRAGTSLPIVLECRKPVDSVWPHCPGPGSTNNMIRGTFRIHTDTARPASRLKRQKCEKDASTSPEKTLRKIDAMFRFSMRILPLLLVAIYLPQITIAQQVPSPAQKYQTVEDVLYREGNDLTEYMTERCRLDVYHPRHVRQFPTVVWFHGGGLKAGKRSVPDALTEQGIAVVAVNYRLHPRVKSPAYIEDAAAAVSWTFKNIENYGGSAKRIFVSGHSAGGYLTSMIGLDKRWLAPHGIDANQIAGLIPFSGHTITHFTIRAERGIDGKQPIVDDMAPLFHVRQEAPPLLLITGDRDLELLGRYEENAYLWRMMQVVDHPDTELFELEGFNHGQMAEPAHPLLLRFVRKISSRASNPTGL